jgi:chromosome partitioning protein
MAPRTIALASSKGGTGKTSLAAALAVQAVRDGGKVALHDWEPQSSLTLWWIMRGKPDNPRLISDTDDPTAAILAARDCDWLFFDTAPSDIDQIERAIMAADLCLIPVSASAFDLVAARTVVELCGEHRRRFAFVLNRENPQRRTLNGSAAKHLTKLGVILSEHVQDRAAYVSALNKGLTGPEHPDAKQAKDARAEIEAVWAAVKKLVRVR